ncbi:MAG: DUF58 domain-containing protein [Roseburia sp.]|nr:DUF58 domain-containing protein [Roseburia sp.]
MIRILGIGLGAAFLFFLQRLVYQKYWNRRLEVQLRFVQPEIFEGESGSLQEIIINAKRLPLHMLKVKFQADKNLIFDAERGSRTTDLFYRNDIFQINGGEKITRTLSFTGGKRGFYQLKNIDLVGTDLFMSCRMYASCAADAGIYVFPRPFRNEEFWRSLQQLNGEVLAKRHLLEDPFEYRGIREYQPFDDVRSINWKATAKTDDLKVNQKNNTTLRSIRIFLNIEDTGILRKTECVEACLQIGAGLSRFFLEQGMQVACYCNGLDCLTSKPMEVAAGGGSGQLKAIYRSLARIDTQKPAVSFRDTFGEKLLKEAEGTVTCLAAPNQYPDFIALLERCRTEGMEFIWYYPVWERLSRQLPASLEERIRILPIL